jgi:hypothetical protein
MADNIIHEADPGFDDFIEETLTTLAESAREKGICIECLSDRLIVELVSGMARSGVAVSAILAMVGDGLDAAETDVSLDGEGRSRRMH